jgi:alcohol-forming fatty acyl-CoA reductase
VFALLQEKNPKFSNCVIPIPGDVSQKNLGLSEEDAQTLIKNVNVVFHAAATVRFDEKLRLAYSINVQGTRDLLKLCDKMENLKVFSEFKIFCICCNFRLVS